ncbi:hypothetical protein BDY21DRAFT_373960 [Lineolata rhizophorae]|uniref:BHLH domain-containing protein n=1 Tax=Lineolata rhizophorae TaxID=578093 RepID=A0A6A6NTE7_9PEZI|nr:hypothetical protein BDY21DRAFT_373960 [Lineolata rhizophorae]
MSEGSLNGWPPFYDTAPITPPVVGSGAQVFPFQYEPLGKQAFTPEAVRRYYFQRLKNPSELRNTVDQTFSAPSFPDQKLNPVWDEDMILEQQSPELDLSPKSAGLTEDTIATPPDMTDDSNQMGHIMIPAHSTPPSPSPSLESPTTIAVRDVNPDQEQRPKRKRGRPRIHRTTSTASTASNSSSGNSYGRTVAAARRNSHINHNHANAHRVPHNQVERKYREGLNAELERLRQAIPTLPKPRPGAEDSNAPGAPKPSKATVLAAAIDYIKFLEDQVDYVSKECDRLRGVASLVQFAGARQTGVATAAAAAGLRSPLATSR